MAATSNPSTISEVKADADGEASDSSSTTLPFCKSCNKKPRHNNGDRPSPSSKFKGVLSQPNRNWGTQIYVNQQRIWLGTFRSEEEAAMAYDSATILLRCGDSHRNLPWTSDSVDEQNFQSLYSQKVVLAMIKDGSYRPRFDEFLRVKLKTTTDKAIVVADPPPVDHAGSSQTAGGLLCKQLFWKELTPSDVGKLNRLVIPKKYATKYFPTISENVGDGDNDTDGGLGTGVEVFFYDQSMKSWQFRYCYWSSSQSFVFTRGWSKFVKEKTLMANDTITFYICQKREQTTNENQTFYMIGISRSKDLIKIASTARPSQKADMVIDAAAEKKSGLALELQEEANSPRKVKGLKLFGVQIN